MRIKFIDPRNEPRWDEFVGRHELACVYHSASWARVLADSFGYEPCYLIGEDSNGAIRTGLPLMKISSWLTGKRLVSLPRTHYVDPLVGDEKDLRDLLEPALEMVGKNEVDYVELKSFQAQWLKNLEFKIKSEFYRHRISLGRSIEEIWRDIRKDYRRCVRIAQNDLKIRHCSGEEDLRIFYRLYLNVTRRHIIPPRPFLFFKHFHDEYARLKALDFYCVESEGKPASGTLEISHGKHFDGEYMGADYGLLKHYPNHYLTWNGIERAVRHGRAYYSFGVCPRDNKSLRDYKQRWGGVEEEVYSGFYPDIKGYKAHLGHKDKKGPHSSSWGLWRARAKAYLAARLYRHFG